MASKDERHRTVPKFGSFKPKPTPSKPAEPQLPSEKPQEAIVDHDSKAAKVSDSHSRKNDSEYAGHRGDHHRPSSSSTPSAQTRDHRKAPAGASNDVFFVDKSGDPLILRYGSNDRSRVPSYRRSGWGRLMGAAGIITINRDKNREEFSIRGVRDRGNGSAFRNKNSLAEASQSKPKRIRSSADGTLSTEVDDFVALEPPRKRRRGEGASSPEPGGPDYRSIYGKTRAADDPDSRSESGSDASAHPGDEVDDEMSTAKRKSIELSRRVRESPEDIEAWIMLVKLQDSLFRENEGDVHQRSTEEAKGLAGLKLSLYKEALPHATAPLDRQRILHGIMREGSKVWDPKALRKRWDEVMKTDGDSFMFWKSRLDFELTQTSTFTYEGLISFVLERLRILNEALSKASAAEEARTLSSQLVYVFLRLTRFLHDTGRSELAVSAWQATLELTFSRPPEDEDFETSMSSFSDFWQSEVPRMGEIGANGWRHFVDATGIEDPPEAKMGSSRDDPQTRDPFKAWASIEQQETAKSRMPARTLDEESEDDPFRVVMFSDLKDLLPWFPLPIIDEARLQLLDAFLVFCRLPTAGLSNSPEYSDLNDTFVAGPGQAFEITFRADFVGEKPFEISKKMPEFRQQGGIMALSQEVLFPASTWFRYLDKWTSIFLTNTPQVDASWALRTLQFLVRTCGIEEIAEYYLAMEWLNEPSGARTVAKGLLKQYSSNMKLYNAYALIEWGNGNVDLVNKVLSSVTSQKSPSATPGSQLVWNTWTWLHLESSQMQIALSRLCSSVDPSLQGSAVSPALILKAKSHFSSTRDYSLSSLQLEISAQHAESLALLEYLTSEGCIGSSSGAQGNIVAAMASITSFSTELASRNLSKSPYHESLLQTAARLLYYHATHGQVPTRSPYRPSYMREQLLTFVALFPRNTIFLELFAWAESGLRIDDPVRDILESMSLAEPYDCVATRRFAVQHEAHAGTVHSTRAAFEAALVSDTCRGNVDLWIHYLRFVHSARELKAKVKDVFYRAIAACPWSKELYMEAFGTLVKDMSSSELRSVFSILAEKGLRVHVDLDEFLEGWKNRRW
ncbi:NRDE-2, necessary for RNA interference-domain-containing protein [Podospora didyma]|uniref:NRDE-2, necessary for RNA interference-domain-containing protein n=1 Tax=Podospora didyma TaxID=330526 RepID=A0AAE0KFN8_9PEZI|nr:NRDE-2, necessary for RNA interference-domain-containing protein [Podospora didyma]